jgi:hypothetical protein
MSSIAGSFSVNEETPLTDSPPPLAVIEVKDESTLSTEVDRVKGVLASLQAHWEHRLATMQRITELAKDEKCQKYSSFLPRFLELHTCLCTQLQDRRSKVTKQACATLTTLAYAFQARLLNSNNDDDHDVPNELKDNLDEETLNKCKHQWTSMTEETLNKLFLLGVNTTEAMSQPAKLAFRAIAKAIGPLYIKDFYGKCPLYKLAKSLRQFVFKKDRSSRMSHKRIFLH